MTCIVALEHKGKVIIGGDSAGVAGYSLSVRADEKVFVNHGMPMGFTTSFRMGQILRYSFKPPKKLKKQSDMEYMVTSFIDSVRKTFKNKGYLRVKDSNNESGGTFIVGYKGKMYVIYDDFQVAQQTNNFHAVGCGVDLALGSLASTDKLIKDPYERVNLALHTAERFSAGVCGPFILVEG